MTRLELNGLPAHVTRLRSDVRRIARSVVRDPAGRDDLTQQMLLHLLSLPADRPRRFYLRALRRLAVRHWGRCLVDAPLDHSGQPILERQTVAVGGLRELDSIHRRQAA